MSDRIKMGILLIFVGFTISSVSSFSFPVRQNQRAALSTRHVDVPVWSLLAANRGAALSSSTKEENDDAQVPAVSRQKLTNKYKAGSIVFGLVSLILATMPDRNNAAQLANKYGGAAGYGLAAATCHLLADATSNERLTSDTYKRLNIGLFFFCFISLFSIPGEAAFHPQFGPAVLLMTAMTVIKGWGCTLAYEGWKTGVQESNDNASSLSPKQMLSAFGKGIKSTMSGIYNTPRKGFVYLIYLLLVLVAGFSAVMEAQFYLKYNAPVFNISLQWSALARLSFVASIVYSLKDASERNRLTGTTFITLNFMIALWALSVAIGQGIYRRGLSFSKSPMLLMCIPFLYGGIRSLYQKSNKKPPPPALTNSITPTTDTPTNSVPDAMSNERDSKSDTSPSLDSSTTLQSQSLSDGDSPPSRIDSETTSPPSEIDPDSESTSEQSDEDNDDPRKS